MWCKCCVLCNHNRLQIPVIDRLASLNLENLTFFTADDDLISYFFFSCIDTSVMSTWIMPMIYAITASLGFNSFLTHFLIQYAVHTTAKYIFHIYGHLFIQNRPSLPFMVKPFDYVFCFISNFCFFLFFLMKIRLFICSPMKISEFLD
jgi:hypothetical protein